jgi:dimethylglycine dehydrogenase
MWLSQEFISPKEVAERHPLIDPKHYHAALWDDLGPSGATYDFAKFARHHGAQYFTHTPVTATTQRSEGSWHVMTREA